jgi:amidophosphoribosyltransferase
MSGLQGPTGVGHVRYPTVGSNGERDSQPFAVNSPFGIVMAHNGNLTNYRMLRESLVRDCHRYVDSNCDVEVILNVFADELARAKPPKLTPDEVFRAVAGTFERAKGAYSVVGMIAGLGLFAFRDPAGVKPLLFGRKEVDGKPSYAVSSESVVLDILGFKDQRDVANGEAICVDQEGLVHSKRIVDGPHFPCIFEHVYFARPDSKLDGISVYRTRRRFGEKLAEEWRKTGVRLDAIIPVPDSARTAALAMAQALGVRYSEGLVKNRYIGRTFIMADQAERQASIRYKLNPVRDEIEGKDVLLVDDSIVRGNTSRQIIQIVRDAGARHVYFASCCPPLRHPCVYGIDMATKSEFVARDLDVEDVRRAIGADFLLYQTLEGMIEAARAENPEIRHFCTACFTGCYPTLDATPDVVESMERERSEEREANLAAAGVRTRR